ncbi:MAG: MFS transporter [Pirellulales bacterium]
MQPTSPRSSLLKVVLTSFIGTTIEWYDFYIYGTAAALVFNKLFFPTIDPVAGTMAAFATYAVGFFARPVGGVVFGHFGDKLGRKSMLVTTLVMMGLATFLIGLLPTYDTIGLAAPVLLVLLRFVQGFAVGGEWGGAVLMVVEHGHRGQRGFYGSWAQAGVPAGLLLATGVFAVCSRMPDDEFLAWGWRVAFLLGIVLTGIGLFIRLQVLESPLFTAVRTSRGVAAIPILQVLRAHPRNVLLTMGARMVENASFYVISVFVLSYATEQLGLPRAMVLNGVLLASGLQFVAIPAFGALSDRLGRRPVYLAGAICMGLYAFPFFWLLDSGSTALVWLAIGLGLVIHAAMYGPQAAFFSELFGTHVRYSGASLGYQLASPLAGGLAPLIATALLNETGGRPWSVAAYLIVLSIITMASVFLAAETFRADLHGTST